MGKTLQLTASNQEVTWFSSNSAVAKVDGNGVVTGVKAGTATITAKTVDGGKTSTLKLYGFVLVGRRPCAGSGGHGHLDNSTKQNVVDICISSTQN